MISIFLVLGLAAQDAASDIVSASGIKAGICVHAGCGDGTLTAKLAGQGDFIVHAVDPAGVEGTRQALRKRGLYGRVSAETVREGLPYADSIVNLLVMDDPGRVGQAYSYVEVMRVLRPGGAAVVPTAGLKSWAGGGVRATSERGSWSVIVKPRPETMDDWSHADYDASGVAVSKDTAIGPLKSVRWVAGPEWPLGLYYQVGNGGMVSAGGRLFSVTIHVAENIAKDPLERDRSYHLTARDAFNGALLWTRPLPHPSPGQGTGLAHALVAQENRVFVLLDGALLALDAETGEKVRSFGETRSKENRVALAEGVLVLGGEKDLRALDADSGRKRWSVPVGATDLLIHGGKVFSSPPRRRALMSFDLRSGEKRWETDIQAFGKIKRRLLFVQDGFVVFVGMESYKPGTNGIYVFSTETGKLLWKKGYTNPRAHWPESVHYLGKLIWIRTGKGHFEGLDPRSGASKRRLDFQGSLTGGCFRNIATERYLIGTRPLNLIDLQDGIGSEFRGGRHACRAGIAVANGLLYTMPHGCKCVSSAVRGFLAFAPESEAAASGERLILGPAASDPLSVSPMEGQWPTYRHNARRTAGTSSEGPAEVGLLWESELESPNVAMLKEWECSSAAGERMTGPVVSDGVVLVSLMQTHQVVAVDASTGKARWTHTGGGRMDAPPSLFGGRCFIGSRDGWVTALRLKDGALAWKFRAAPKDQRILAFGQLECRWPVIGGVTVHEGRVFCVAGRSGAVDGGMTAYALDAKDGTVVWESPIREGGRSDVGRVDGGGVMLGRLLKLDLATGKKVRGGINGLWSGSNRIVDRAWETLSADDRALHWMRVKQGFGEQSAVSMIRIKHKFQPGEGSLVAADPERGRVYAFRVPYIHWNVKPKDRNERGGSLHLWEKGEERWTVEIENDFQVESLVVAGGRLYAAGPVDRFGRKRGGMVQVFETDTGRRLQKFPLDVRPVSEGLAVAGGRLFISLEDGRLFCTGAK